MCRIFAIALLIVFSSARAETVVSISQNTTSVMLSKQSLLGMQLSIRNQFKNGKATEDALNCINNLEYGSFFTVVDDIFNSELNFQERQQANAFYSGSTGKNIQSYTNEQLYKYAGFEPNTQIILSNSDIDQYASFGQTSAGQKLLNQKVMESPSAIKKIGRRIMELLKACNALPGNP